MTLFNRSLLQQNRNRISDKFLQVNFIHQEMIEIITEIVMDCKRNFNFILEIGARDGSLGQKVSATKKCQKLIQVDCSSKMVSKYNLDLVMDDENLSFPDQSFDLILSNLNLHFINNIPQNLLTIRKLLKPNGLFIGSFFGEANLKELRETFLQIEQKFYNAISPRIIPNIDVKTAGMLLQKAGFFDTVSQKHSFEVEYSHPKNILNDLKNMGESNIINNKSKKFITKTFLFELTNLYQKLYSRPNNQSLATFETIIVTGWNK